MPKAKEIGRFIYIEPNNLNVDKPYNAIPQPYEDYCMAVDLQVEIPSRDSCGDPTSKKILYFSSDNGTISFFGGSGGGEGKQGYLTTNYTDVSATNVGQGNKECLGISSINVTYNSWFYPTVTINFVDVRGASLMMPQEYAYRTELSNKSSDITQINGGSFFKALFSFPYPVFKLTIKGFYGKAVTYKLAVSDFRASFNSQTGNFECVANFIGYMFGVYADIPMTYLAIAPYIGRGTDTKYGPIWEESNFHFHGEDEDGNETQENKMLTYPEFKLAIYSANTQLNKIVASTKVALDMNEVRKKKTALNEIKTTFSNLGFKKIVDDRFLNGYFYYTLVTEEKDFDFGERLIDLRDKVEKYCNANYSNKDSRSLELTLAPLFELIENEDGKNYAHRRAVIEYDRTKTPEKYWAKQVYGDDTNIDNVIRLNKNNREEFIGKLEGIVNATGSKICYLISFTLTTDFIEYLDSQDREYERKSKEFESGLEEERLSALKQVLGFYPSIKNIFDMSFAHMEVFVKEYFKMLNNIRSEMASKTRSAESLGISSKEESDLRIHSSDNPTKATNPSDAQVPPFPLFVKEVIENNGTKMNKVVGPWEFKNENMNMQEMQFVIKLLNASKYYSEETKNINDTIERSKDAQLSTLPDVSNLVPVTLYDFANSDSNPYQCVQSSGDMDDDRLYQIALIFFLRWYYFSLTFGSETAFKRLWLHDDMSDEHTQYFAQMEAYNLKNALPKITNTIRNGLLKGNSHEKLISAIFNGDKHFLINEKNKIATTTGNKLEVVYNWIEPEKGKRVLPIGEFNINGIKNDLANGSYRTSKKYVTIKGETFSEEDNFSNFKIDTNGNLFNETISAIKNADDGCGNVKNEIIDSIKEDSIFTNAKKKEDPYIANIFTAGKKTAAAHTYTSNYGVAMTVPSSEYEQTYSLIDVLDGKVSSEDSENIKIVGDGTAVEGDLKKSLFREDFYVDEYRYQPNDISKAYLFVMSLPIKTKIFDNGDYMINNGTTLKSLLLREGAYYWRYDYMKEHTGLDPISITIDRYKPALREELYITNERENNTLSFIKKNDKKLSYIKFKEYATTTGRREAVKNYFLRWVDTEFKNINYYYSNNVNYYRENEDYIKLIKDILTDFETVIDCAPRVLTKKDGKSGELYRPRKNNFESAFKKFVDKLKELYNEKDDEAVLTTETNLSDATDFTNDKDLMLSTYLVLKSLYDKWFCGANQETWHLDSPISDFKNFKYIDSYYNNIGYKLIPNVDKTLALVDDYLPAGTIRKVHESTQYSVKSVLEFLSENCESIGVWLQTLPLMYGLDPTDKEKIETMFDAIPFSKFANGTGMTEGETYLCMYTYKPSEHADLRDDTGQYMYSDDGFDIADINGETSNILPTALNEVGKNTIPAFGVTYAAQNQSYFKSIAVSMENPMQTDVAIQTTLAISNKASDMPREVTFYGQDLYRIYSNHSYTCTVEMMGNAQITPMMYFQLNNIPMFRGAYMIIKVEHNIKSGSMTTKFTGVRQSKQATPLAIGATLLLNQNGEPVVGYGRDEGSPFVFNNLTEEEITEIFRKNGGRFDCDKAILAMYNTMSDSRAGRTGSWCAMNTTGGKGNCAGFVRRYVEAGGISTNPAGHPRPEVASKYIEWLQYIGFFNIAVISASELTGDVSQRRKQLREKTRAICQRGDICVMHHLKDSVDFGHICMWNDLAKDNDGQYGVWVSDFKQLNGPWCYSSENPKDMYIFRFGREGDTEIHRIITSDLKPPF